MLFDCTSKLLFQDRYVQKKTPIKNDKKHLNFLQGGTMPRGANSQLCGQYNEPVEVSCPVCFEVPLPPRKIFQCSQGHTLCDLCLSKIDKKCPTCR